MGQLASCSTRAQQKALMARSPFQHPTPITYFPSRFIRWIVFTSDTTCGPFEVIAAAGDCVPGVTQSRLGVVERPGVEDGGDAIKLPVLRVVADSLPQVSHRPARVLVAVGVDISADRISLHEVWVEHCYHIEETGQLLV